MGPLHQWGMHHIGLGARYVEGSRRHYAGGRLVLYQDHGITVTRNRDDIATLTFDLKDKAINTLSRSAIQELRAAVKALQVNEALRGLRITSARDDFSVGAYISGAAVLALLSMLIAVSVLRKHAQKSGGMTAEEFSCQ